MRSFLIIFFMCAYLGLSAQTNTFPADGDVGIGTVTPIEKLDIVGNLYLRNPTHSVGAGASISLSSYDFNHIGPIIRSYLDYASGTASSSRLILSSYHNGYQNELTLMQGRVGIGTINPQEKLSVNGNIRAKEIKVENANWPDYVFADDYKLPTLQETEQHIKEKGRLPNIPSADEVKANGIDLGEMNAKLLQKIEELTLYLIEIDKAYEVKISSLQEQIDQLKSKSNEKN